MTRLDVLNALRSSSSVDEAAAGLGLTPSELRAFAFRHHMGAAYRRLERGDSTHHHPAFVDMTERTLCGDAIVVERREANSGNGNARWRVRLVACGHTMVRDAIALRAADKAGRTPRCPECGPKRPGTVRRRVRAC